MLPFTAETWNATSDALHLPATYHQDLARDYALPLTFTIENPAAGSPVGLSFKTIQNDSQLTMGLNYNPRDCTTTAFFGFRCVDKLASFGKEILKGLERSTCGISEPLLLPFLVYEQLEFQLRNHISTAAFELEIFNRDRRFIDIFPTKQPDTSDNNVTIRGFDELHKTIVNYHAVLTNSYGPFLTSFGLSLEKAISKLEEHFGGKYGSFHSRQCLDLMVARSRYLLLSRDRLLSKIDIYLQVIHNFMQQDIAHETKRDSSAMKSLSLLTMVFLPATAIATIMAPFTKISDDDMVKVTSQFWVFWAAAGPITLLVVMMWVCWIQRAEIQNSLATKVEQLRKIEMLQKRTTKGDTESNGVTP
ncbi:hypothetical protein QBC44DRAFT_290037 [Cladorrhinum sp. PSN332]|nr:hypothetical protein QBC44DRAFT_290037 [Cladorrhinum sp. PSN332]